MNRTRMILTPPLAFALAAILAWLTGRPVEDASASENHVVRSPRQREAAMVDAGDPSVVLAELENRILDHPDPPGEIHDAEGMDAALDLDDRTSMFPGGGMSTISYAIDWAEEAPEELFAWLVHQSGSSFHRGLHPCDILFRAWAEKDMEAALAAVLTIPNRDLRQQALISSLEVLCKSDPDRARGLMMQNLGIFPPDGKIPIFSLFETGDVMCDMLISLPPSGERTHLLANVLRTMAGRNHELALQAQAVWQQSPEDLRRELVAAGFKAEEDLSLSFAGLEELLRERAETAGDPACAERFMESQGPTWARRDLAGALDWAQAHLKGKNRVERSAELFKAAAGQDLDTALRIWQTLPDSFLKTSAAEAISRGAPDDRKTEAAAILQSR